MKKNILLIIIIYFLGTNIVCAQLSKDFERRLEEAVMKAVEKHSKSDRWNDSERESREAEDAAREMRIREERRLAEEARKRAEEAERIRKEEEFRSDKAELQGSLRGTGSYSFSSGYKNGLRGFSQDKSTDNKYSNGLKGFYENSPLSEDRSYYSYELRGYSDNEQQQVSNLHTSVPEITDANYYEDFSNRPTPNRPNNSVDITNARVRPRTEAMPYYILKPVAHIKGVDYENNKSLLERFEQQIDVWRESGKHEILTYVGDKITGFTRKTISSSSAIGAQIVKVYDILKDIAEVKNTEKSIIDRSFDAINKTVVTGDRRYIDESLQYAQQKANDQQMNILAKKGVIPSGHKSVQNEVKKVNNELAELWLSSKIVKK